MSTDTAPIAPGDPATQPVTCTHCGLPVPRGLVEPDTAEQFCCNGCRTVYEMIHACGLDGYYTLRDDATGDMQQARTTSRSYKEFDEPDFAEQHITTSPAGLKTIELYLEGVHCTACVWLVERLPMIEPGVVECRLNYRQHTARITWDDTATPMSKVARRLDRLGYPPHPLHDATDTELHRMENRKQLIRIAVAGACAGNAMLAAIALYAGDAQGMAESYRSLLRWTSMLIGIVALLGPGRVFFRGAIAALRTRVPHMDMPIALGLGVGGIAGAWHTVTASGEVYFDSLAALVFLLLLGRYIQYRQQRRADERLSALYALTPRTALRVQGDELVETAIESLRPGEIVEVPAGGSVPVDGVVCRGNSEVDRALLTGESIPVAVTEGDAVNAGSVNLASPIRVRVDAAGQATRLARLIELVSHAAGDKPRIVQFADRISGWFVVVVSLAAAVTFAVWWSHNPAEAVDHAVALLIVACPCALGLATPLAVAVAIGRAARNKVLIKSGHVLEQLAGRGTIVLDKTGTLTEGRMTLASWWGDESIRPAVAALEKQCQHPVADALAGDGKVDETIDAQIVQRSSNGIEGSAGDRSYAIGSVSFIESLGITIPPAATEQIQRNLTDRLTPVVVAVDGGVSAVAGVGDALREETRRAIDALQEMGWRLHIASGDHPEIVSHIAGQLGLDPADARGGMSPEDKLDRVRELGEAGPVVMVGDGVNDAAAMAASSVGLAVHGGAEAALAAADAYFASPGLGGVTRLFIAAKRTLRTIRLALGVSLAYNAVAVALAAAGIIGPLIAAVIMPLSSLTVVLIAMSANTFDEA